MVYAFDDYTGYNVVVEGKIIGKVVQESEIKKVRTWADPVRDLTVKMRDNLTITVRTDELEQPGIFRIIYDLFLGEKSLVLKAKNKKENTSRNLTSISSFNVNLDTVSDMDDYR